MASVSWIKCQDGNWCNFDDVRLDLIGETVGVYVIWHQGNPSATVRVGQGIIKDRISEHRKDQKVTQYRNKGTLRVTWAAVPKAADRDGIERYLANHYAPLVGDSWPDVAPVAVNLPGA